MHGTGLSARYAAFPPIKDFFQRKYYSQQHIKSRFFCQISTWKLCVSPHAEKQKKIRILVAGSRDNLLNQTELLWDCEKETEEISLIYGGSPLESRSSYYYKIILTCSDDSVVSSDICLFETGFLSHDCWHAKWICLSEAPLTKDCPEIDEEGEALPIQLEDILLGPVHQVRREFTVKKKLRHARLYMTAHGIYLPMLDGKKVGHYELAPGHSDYQNQLFYQIYDITGDLAEGTHTIGAYVADGWYRGRIGFAGDNCQYGDELALLLQLELEYADGEQEFICSDEKFQITEGGYLYADIMVGEKYDARLEKNHFFENSYTDPHVRHPGILQEDFHNLRAEFKNHMEVIETLCPQAIYRLNSHEVMLDFGKNVAGKAGITLHEKAGQEIRIEHSEVEGPGHTFLKNIITPYRDQTEIYICKGADTEYYEPMFTYHGFRYVKITGITGDIQKEQFQAKVIGTKMDTTGCFTCSDERLNQLQENIMRSQLSNMISIPTDCPQREKAGWTGDVQIYASTACFNQDVKDFFLRWLSDVRYSQSDDGQIPIIVPFLPGHGRSFEGIGSSAGWSDVIVILPWVLYQYYGDKSILEDNYEAMEKWVAYIEHTAASENPDSPGTVSRERAEALKYIWNTGFHFGDWLTPSASINPETGIVDLMQSAILTMDIVPTFFFAYSCRLMEQISLILGRDEKASHYSRLFEKIKNAFRQEYMDDSQTIKSNLQGIQVLALDTGFLSVPYLMDVLTEAGYKELAYKLLYNEECPSWLYEVKMGATSIWESWQALLPDGTCSYVSMAHYAFGCIGDWIYRQIVGIQSLAPGYKKICFSPDFNCGLSWAKGNFESIYGTIACEWHLENNKALVDVAVPFNTTAVLKTGSSHINLKPGKYHYEFTKEEYSQ